MTTNTVFRQTETGYVYWNKSPDLVNVSESQDYILIDTGTSVRYYDKSNTLLDEYSGQVAALFNDTAYMKDGLIVRLVSGACTRVGTYRGTPVAREYCIYNKTLVKYATDQMGRISHADLCECEALHGSIVYSGFDLTNRNFVIVSEYATLHFTYDVSYNFTFVAKYNHAKAVGFAEGAVILSGEGEPGKLTDLFDVSGSSNVYKITKTGDEDGTGYFAELQTVIPQSVTIHHGTTTFISSHLGGKSFTPGSVVVPLISTAGGYTYEIYVVLDSLWSMRYQLYFDPVTPSNSHIYSSLFYTVDEPGHSVWILWPTHLTTVYYGNYSGGFTTAADNAGSVIQTTISAT